MQIQITDFEETLTGLQVIFRDMQMIVRHKASGLRPCCCGKRCPAYYLYDACGTPRDILTVCEIRDLEKW